MFNDEFFGDDDCTCCSVAGGTALQLRQRIVDLGRVQNLIQSVDIPKLRVGVIGRVAVILFSNLCKVFNFCTILLNVF